MPSISILKEKFDNLPMTADNMALYQVLLFTDISDYKPVMEQILLGKIDIEDTRQIFYNYSNYNWARYENKNLAENIYDARISTNIMDTISNNIVAALEGNEDAIIKESIIIPTQDNLKNQIASEFKKRTGLTMTKAEIDAILPIVNSELFVELSLLNPNAVKDKEHQNLFSDLLAFKPKANI